ncbi:AMP-binding protein [Persicobacter diffluens]|uniref:O-succinylbenzoic acid--CoA ligase n=1 Tax=Persicobacter diffluens TaxID=981 RepID=A0AAN5ALC0_9BACT|nr:O-succinylbenzoic acid--CoA ligase [Persicobacter diffluens]
MIPITINGKLLSDQRKTFTAIEKEILHFVKAWEAGQEDFELHTSGSTGTPKAIKISRKQMEQSALMTARALQLQKGDRAVLGMNPNMVGGRMMIVRALVTEMALEVVEASLNPLLDMQQPFDFTALVPMQLDAAIENPHSYQLLNQAKVVIIGGAPMSEGLIQKCQKLKCIVYATYGMTETVSHIALKAINGPQPQKDFHTLSGVKIQRDERGCLQIESPTAAEDVITTNDLVELTSPSSFRWLGRIDRTINTGGIKIQAELIENAIEKILTKHHIKAHYFIEGTQDQKLGQKISLFVETSSTDREFQGLIKTKLITQLPNRYHLPKCFILVDKFKLLPSGKVDRRGILQDFENDQTHPAYHFNFLSFDPSGTK